MKMGEKKIVEKEKFKTISIPAQLFERIEKEIKGTSFTSVSNYITYVLKETLAESEEEETLTKEDEKLVKARLRALGYIE